MPSREAIMLSGSDGPYLPHIGEQKLLPPLIIIPKCEVFREDFLEGQLLKAGCYTRLEVQPDTLFHLLVLCLAIFPFWY